VGNEGCYPDGPYDLTSLGKTQAPWGGQAPELSRISSMIWTNLMAFRAYPSSF
jgi:hypothetical protein